MHFWSIILVLGLLVLSAVVSVQAAEWEPESGLWEQLFNVKYPPLTLRQYACVACSDLWRCQPSALNPRHLYSVQMIVHAQEVKRVRKSPKAAFFLSFLLPGAGQYYAEAPQQAKLFLGIESSLWALFLGFRTYGSWHESDYCSFAIEHADVNPTGQSDEYLDDLGFYASASEYNRYMLRENGPQAILYTSNDAWEWDSDASRLEYKALRKSSLLARRRATYVLGGVLVHRIFSAIHAVRLARAWNEGTTKPEKHLQVYLVGLQKNEPALGLAFVKRF